MLVFVKIFFKSAEATVIPVNSIATGDMQLEQEVAAEVTQTGRVI